MGVVMSILRCRIACDESAVGPYMGRGRYMVDLVFAY